MGIVWLVIGINAAVWTLVILGFRLQRGQIEKQVLENVGNSGEYLVLRAQNGYYAKMKDAMSIRSMGVIALTNKRLVFKVMFGKGFDIRIEDITGLSTGKWFQGMYRNGREFMILKLRDGSEIGFQTKNQSEWMEEIRRLAAIG